VSLSFDAVFRERHQALPNPTPQDMPDDHRPDPDDAADFELPDQQELIDAFMAGLCKESHHDCRGLVQKPLVIRSQRCIPVQRQQLNDKVRERVATERKNLLHRDGQPRDRCKEKVLNAIH
jgi:hypothetical protein